MSNLATRRELRRIRKRTLSYSHLLHVHGRARSREVSSTSSTTMRLNRLLWRPNTGGKRARQVRVGSTGKMGDALSFSTNLCTHRSYNVLPIARKLTLCLGLYRTRRWWRVEVKRGTKAAVSRFSRYHELRMQLHVPRRDRVIAPKSSRALIEQRVHVVRRGGVDMSRGSPRLAEGIHCRHRRCGAKIVRQRRPC